MAVGCLGMPAERSRYVCVLGADEIAVPYVVYAKVWMLKASYLGGSSGEGANFDILSSTRIPTLRVSHVRSLK